MIYKKNRVASCILFSAGIVSLMLSSVMQPDEWVIGLLTAGLVSVLAGAVLMIKYRRCPFCGQKLPHFSPKIIQCPKCYMELP